MTKNLPEEADRTAQADGPLAGKTAIVTGASRGIGRAIALRLARDGAKVLVGARTEAALTAVVADITAAKGAARSFAADLRRPDAPGALLAAALDAYGGVDIIVNNAGATRRGDFLALDDAAWEDGFALKFFGAVRLTRAAWPHLTERKGSVLNIIGVGGRTPLEDQTIAGSVNAAGLAFTKALADRGIRDGVQVNAINPGLIQTDRLQSHLDEIARERGEAIEIVIEQVIRENKITRIGDPSDIANLAAFILSPQGALIHGALIDVDAGRTKAI